MQISQEIGMVAYGKRKGYGNTELIFFNNSRRELSSHKPEKKLRNMKPVNMESPAIIAGPDYVGRVTFFHGSSEDNRDHSVSQFILFNNIHEYQAFSLPDLMNIVIPQNLTEKEILDGFDRRKELAGCPEFCDRELDQRQKAVLFKAIKEAAAGERVMIRTERPEEWKLMILQVLSTAFLCAYGLDFDGYKTSVSIAVNCNGFEEDVLIDENEEEFHEDGLNDVFSCYQSLSEFLKYAEIENLKSFKGILEEKAKYSLVQKFRQCGIESLLEEETMENVMLAKKRYFELYQRVLGQKEKRRELSSKVRNLICGIIEEEFRDELIEAPDAEYVLAVLLLAFKKIRTQREMISQPFSDIAWSELWKFVEKISGNGRRAKKNKRALKSVYLDMIEGGTSWFSS